MNNLECSPLEESFGILMLLFVSIKQNFESALYYENNLSNDSERFSHFDFPEKSSSEVDATIIDALRFQFLLQVCSFIDEWDNFTGVTNGEFDNRIRIIKRVVKPARKALNKFPDIKKFRNEIIAHNYRDNKKNFTFNKLALYNVPNSFSEMYLVLYSIGRMIDVLYINFQDEYNSISNILVKEFGRKPILRKIIEEEEIKKIIAEIKIGIDDCIFDIPRFDIASSITGVLNKEI